MSARLVLYKNANVTGEAVETWHLADLVSGAMIASIVERAKAAAVKDALAGRRGLTTAHLLQALHAEVAESAELPGASDPEEWARVVGRGQRTDPANQQRQNSQDKKNASRSC